MSILNNIYNKQLLTEIHKYNHIETSETAFISNNDLQYEVILHDQYTVEEKMVKIHGPLKFGRYFFSDYIFLLDIDMVEGEYIEWIRNTKFTQNVQVFKDEVNVPYRRYVDDNDFVIEFDEIPTMSKIFVYCKGKDIEINAERIINEDIEGIISDLNITTELKEKVDKILFSDKSIKDKRFAIRRMRSLPSVFRKMFLKLLEYIAEV